MLAFARRSAGNRRWCRSSPSAGSRATRARAGDSYLNRIHHGVQHALRRGAFIETRPRQRLIRVYLQRFACIQDFRIAAGDQPVADLHRSFFHCHNRGALFIVHADIEHRAANGNGCGGRLYPVRIRPAKLLDLYANSSHQHVEHIAPVRRIIAENNFGIGENFKRAAVGYAENRVPIGAADNHLFGLNCVANIQCPGLRVPQNRHLTR